MGYKTYTCPIARECGGCEWLAVPYPIQLRRKGEQMRELFAEMAEADGATIDDVRGMDEPLAYRYKAATPFAPGKGGRLHHGFYAAGSHRIVACESCLVEDPQARRVMQAVARIASDLRLPAYAEDRGTGVLRHAVVRSGWKTDDMMLVLVTNGAHLPKADALTARLHEACPELTTIVQNVNDRRTNAILGRECTTLFGPGKMHDELLGCTFEIGPTSFYQTNPAQTEVLYGLAIEAALGEDAGKGGTLRLLDAYCGTGTIGICAASRANNVQVTGVEQVGGAVKCAKRNARANGLDERCRFIRADATEFLTAAARSGENRYDVVLMDPPRAGSTPEFLEAVTKLSPARVVYVSCNATTQARDLQVLRQGGYRLERVSPVDMFPHTKHVETVVSLAKS